jgi:hypothetical protein
MTKLYARIQDGRVVELAAFGSDPSALFHPAVQWTDVSDVTDVAIGWTFDGQKFSPPTFPDAVSTAVSLASLQARLSDLAAQIALLSRADGA